MSVAGKPFVGVVPQSDKRPRSAFFAPYGQLALIRDNFALPTWICLGAAAQGLLSLLVGRLALLPAVAFLLYRTFIAYAMSIGWMHNTYMDGVILKKTAAQFPDEEGNFSATPADNDVVVFLIGTRVNHPLGLLAPGYAELGGMFQQMVKDCEDHAEEFGFLGMTSWQANGTRKCNNELLMVGYFRTPEGLHAFAHSKYHTDAWEWWNKSYKSHPHLSIYHENYHVPKGHWENVYINSHASHFGSSTFKTYDSEKGGDVWTSPLVDASKGLLRTSEGRMSRGKGDENDSIRAEY